MSDKLKKLEEQEKKAQEAFKRARAELKRERDAKAKIEEDERNAWLILLATAALKLVKNNPSSRQIFLQSAKGTLSENYYQKLLEGLEKDGVDVSSTESSV